MIDHFQRKWGKEGPTYLLGKSGLLKDKLHSILQRKNPIFLMGTALGFLALFEYCRKNHKDFVLPKGSYSIVCVGKFILKNDAARYSRKLKKKYNDCLVRRL